MTRRTRFFNYLVINDSSYVYIRKRTEKDIWQELYEFPLVETEEQLNILRGVILPNFPISLTELKLVKQSQPYQQLLTHQKIIATFWEFEIPSSKIIVLESGSDFQKIERKKLENFALPKTIDIYLKEKVLTLF